MENNSLTLTSAVIGGVVILAVGYLGGILFQTQKTASQLEESGKLIEVMSSKIIPSIVAVGEIVGISGRTIILRAYANEEKPFTFSIEIREDAELTSFVFSAAEEGEEVVIGGSIREEIEFKDIKVGDNVNITLKILSDGSFKGISVIVFPSSFSS